MFKKIIRISIGVFLVTGIVALFSFAQNRENEMLCSKINILISRDPLNENFLVEEDDIRQLIATQIGQVENSPIKNIDINSLERILYRNPWVLNANVYLDIDGVVNVEIEQRKPILRIINYLGENFYMDSNGKSMPWSPKFTPRLLVVTGNIKEQFRESDQASANELMNNDTLKTHQALADFYTLATFILADNFWSAQIEQIYINVNGEIELVPKVGDQKILLGDTKDLAEKFFKLKIFYKEGLNYTGWKTYDTINLEYKNQVVCTKANFIPQQLKTSTNSTTH